MKAIVYLRDKMNSLNIANYIFAKEFSLIKSKYRFISRGATMKDSGNVLSLVFSISFRVRESTGTIGLPMSYFSTAAASRTRSTTHSGDAYFDIVCSMLTCSCGA